MPKLSLLALVTLGAAAPSLALTGQLAVTGSTPGINQDNVSASTQIVLDFDRALDPATVPPGSSSITVFGAFTGVSAGSWSLSNGDTRLTFDPTDSFSAGEPVRVHISNALVAADSSPLQQGGWGFEFRVVAGAASMSFSEITRYNLRDNPNASVRIYGGHSTDLDGDGWIDLSLVNEDSSDVRVLMNLADGSGEYHPFLTPTNDVGSVPSPNEPVDLDGDGLTDMVTANISGGSFTTLFGNGDGTYDGRTDYPMGSNMRGIVCLDADGDGDPDVVTASRGGGYCSIRFNDGTGAFGPQTNFDGASGEFGLAAGDMNNDGLVDLVVGGQSGDHVRVHLSNGDGTFTISDTAPAGGNVWMIVLGDINGDGNLDASTANGSHGNGGILFGDGSGNLTNAQTYAAPSFVTATDLGDMDGDGDLDWVMSSFGGGTWYLYENNGAGGMSLAQTFDAVDNPGCALLYDFDNDSDLDMVLLDEIADEAILMENTNPGVEFCYGDFAGCPCGNSTPVGSPEGCANSTGSGAYLAALGSASVAMDTLAMRVTQLPPNQFGIVFAGHNVTTVPFGDGVRCAGTNLFRYPVTNAGATGTILQENVISLAGYSPGQTRTFQGWHRDPTGPCGNAFNLSSAVSVTLAP